METRIAWLLNLDAELELADPQHYRPSLEMAARIASLRPRLARLLAPLDSVIGVDDVHGCTRALPFCPTPSALARIASTSLAPPPAPPLSVLTAVNSRAFCAELGQTLPGARFVRNHAELHEVLSSEPSGSWLLKREFSFAGRERRRALGTELDAPTAGFVRRSFERGEGLQVEPQVARSADFAHHGYVLRDRRLLLGAPSSQECDARGVWQRSRELSPGELDERESEALEGSCRAAGEALAAHGYFGPFGVDAYRYDDPARGRSFQPRSEINARFSMGYPRALLERALALDGDPSGA
jgi:hypothetical protein